MLTASEKEWLEDRRRVAYCRYCNVSKLCANSFASGYTCPLTAGNMKDAAEFSERVAAKLAEAYGTMMDHNEKHSLCQTCRFEVVKTLGCMSTCAETVLRWAQLEVEEEMNNGMDI